MKRRRQELQTFGQSGSSANSDEDLMEQARKEYIKQSMKRAKTKLDAVYKDTQGSKSVTDQKVELNKSDVKLDPMAEGLFAKLPIPKESKKMQYQKNDTATISLTAAFRGQKNGEAYGVIKIDDRGKLNSKTADTAADDLVEDANGQKMVEVSADDLVNKEDFYRRHLQSHSISMFHKQVLSKAKNSEGADV